MSIHGRNRRISAIKAKSVATFHSDSSGYIHSCNAFLYCGQAVCSEHDVLPGSHIHLSPTELAGVEFHCTGVLDVDWILEIDESAKH